MGRYIVIRVIQAIILLVLVSIITFVLIHIAPGGPSAMMLDNKLSPQRIAQMQKNLGLNQPIPVQYLKWVGNMLHGNFGVSYADSRPVLSDIGARLPNTLILSGTAFGLALLVSIPVGIYGANRAHTRADDFVSGISFIGLAIPVFWFGILLIIIFSVKLGWLPSSGMYSTNQPPSVLDLIKHLIMPAIVLAVPTAAVFVRFVRASVLETLQQDFVRTARSKGLSRQAVTYRHVLRNSLIPIITIVGLSLPAVVGGAAITESVFGWPGMGQLAVSAAFTRDYPTVMAITILVAAVVIIVNLLTDLVYVLIDPRVRLN